MIDLERRLEEISSHPTGTFPTNDVYSAIDEALTEIERLKNIIRPFATSLKVAREAFGQPTDQGHLVAVAGCYINIEHLADAYDAIHKKERD